MKRISEYLKEVVETDQISVDDTETILMGLFGEVGEVMAAAKKVQREKAAFVGFRHHAIEEFGDALWYLAALCRRLEVSLEDVLLEATTGQSYALSVAASSLPSGPVARVAEDQSDVSLTQSLLDLGKVTTELIEALRARTDERAHLVRFTVVYLRSIQQAELTFSEIVNFSSDKARGRYVEPDFSELPVFDVNFPEYEQLPWEFEIEISQRKSTRTYLRWRGVVIGDPLTDNIADRDGYRFHDVFHFGFASILHWSPTFRSLIKHKRKSDPEVDETQDSGRAIVVEEGLSAWIFSYAKEIGFFENQDRVSFDLLKTVQAFVRGYEVDVLPLRMWEKAILDGYRVFRQVRENGGGIVVCNRHKRTISYKPLEGDSE